MYGKTRTGVRTGEEEGIIVTAHDRDSRTNDGHGTSFLRSAGVERLAVVDTFFSARKGRWCCKHPTNPNLQKL